MQQINLYLPEFRPNREPLRSVHMLWGAVALLIFLVLFSLYSAYSNSQLRGDIAAEQSAQQAAQAQLQELMRLQPQSQKIQLEAEIVELTQEKVRRERILHVISRQDLGNTQGFSAQLKTMARQSMDSLAINRFSLQLAGTYIEFSGTTVRADQVPVYIQQLRSEPSFANVGFGVVSVERTHSNRMPLMFRVTNSEEKDLSLGAGDYFKDDDVGVKK
jgi:hypothetical protein